MLLFLGSWQLDLEHLCKWLQFIWVHIYSCKNKLINYCHFNNEMFKIFYFHVIRLTSHCKLNADIRALFVRAHARACVCVCICLSMQNVTTYCKFPINNWFGWTARSYMWTFRARFEIFFLLKRSAYCAWLFTLTLSMFTASLSLSADAWISYDLDWRNFFSSYWQDVYGLTYPERRLPNRRISKISVVRSSGQPIQNLIKPTRLNKKFNP